MFVVPGRRRSASRRSSSREGGARGAQFPSSAPRARRGSHPSISPTFSFKTESEWGGMTPLVGVIPRRIFRRLRICVITSQNVANFPSDPRARACRVTQLKYLKKCFGPFAFALCARRGAHSRHAPSHGRRPARSRSAHRSPRGSHGDETRFAPALGRTSSSSAVTANPPPAGGRLRFWHLAAHGRARAEPACLRVTATGEEPRVGSRPSASRRAARRPRATSTRDSRDRSRGGDAAEEQQIPRGDAVPPHEKVARADILGGKDDESRVRSRASAAARATATARTLALAPTRRASLPRARRTDSNR